MPVYDGSCHIAPGRKPDCVTSLLIVMIVLFIFFATDAFVVAAVTPSSDFSLSYEEMFENHGAIMLIIETNTGRILQVNQAAVDFYGYSDEVFVSMTIQEINQLTPDEVEAERIKAASEERNFFIFQHKLANGEIKTVEVYSWPYSSDNRQLLFSIINDITPQIAANELLEMRTLWFYISVSVVFLLLLMGLWSLNRKRRDLSIALRENEIVRQELVNVKEKYRTILDDIPALVSEFLPDSTLTYVNKGYCDYFGLTEEALIGKRFLELIPEDQHEKVLKKYLSLNRDQPTIFNDQYTLHGDIIKWQEWRNIAIFDQLGHINHYYSVGVDVTERKELMNQLEKEKDRAEAANKAKSQFLTNMSHELRTPLNGFGGMLQLLQLTDLTEEQRELTTNALESTEALTTVISSILDYSKLENDPLKLQQKPFNLKRVTSDCVKLFQSKAKMKGLDLKLNYDEEIERHVEGDPLMLQQVLLPLLGNAIKFTDSGQVSLTVSKMTDGHGERLKFSVDDTGIGMTEEQLDNIFDWFRQGDNSTTKKYEGIGLGLAITKRLVELMHGELKVESNYGEGSRFWFDIDYLPTSNE